ncbi:sugar fermentation stimulation protein [Pontibacillus chungwhensis BH030062]|uniref:Sugar fermentation stimulation protein homolog n=1 Tax=Pontibacillus chungwhensis BH030062 TaxID=1385513 RepID=A0A0A2VHG3_9BACI|nr:DNA/RNA nuclease SfsA [Pontibacillus chungwhensis]KGP93060.1 sugar fermentation stimulation protein [Pontibacillus chungwhensis BH030062]
MFIPFEHKLYKATFIERPNRFILHCKIDEAGEMVRVHLPDPGRLKELLQYGATVYLRYSDKKDRKTKWTAVLAHDPFDDTLVSLQTTLVNHLIEKALKENKLKAFERFTYKAREYRKGHSRWDFHGSEGDLHHLIEVKSVSLGVKGVGYFPDAITKRGTKHVQELTSIVAEEKEWLGSILFVCQRNDLHSVRPAKHIDPTFAMALQEAKQKGVNLLAYSTYITTEGISLKEEIPVLVKED